jgi:antitoxin component YwqK of YwqJK toxin-antitoxin module
MKKLLLFSISVFTILQLSAQTKKSFWRFDPAAVQQKISGSDTSYSISKSFQQADVDLFYDKAMTKKFAEYHFDASGNKTGTWIEYYSTGTPKTVWDYSHSWMTAFPIGIAKYPDEKTKISRYVQNDSLIEMDYFHNGNLSEIRKWTKDGLLVRQTEWCENGLLVTSFNPTAQKAEPVRKYYCDGIIQSEYNWNIMGYSGSYVEYFANGKTSVKGKYEEAPLEANILVPRKTGDWLYYDTNGKLVKTEHWNAGRLMGTDSQ